MITLMTSLVIDYVKRKQTPACFDVLEIGLYVCLCCIYNDLFQYAWPENQIC